MTKIELGEVRAIERELSASVMIITSAPNCGADMRKEEKDER